MSPSLDHIANELLIEICFNLSSSKDLSNFSLCSKHMYSIAEPILYFEISQTGNFVCRDIIRTLTDQPHLARHIKTLDCWALRSSFGDSLSEIWELLRTSDTLEKQTVASRALASLKPPLQAWAVEIAFLFTLLPDLTSFTITHNPVKNSGPFSTRAWEYKYLRQILSSAQALQENGHSSSPLSLSKLQTITFKHHTPQTFSRLDSVLGPRDSRWSHRGPPIEAILPFLRLPSVKTFTCTDLMDGREDWIDPMIFTSQFPTQSLKFSSSTLPSTLIRDFLLCFTSLKSLIYNREYPRIGPLLKYPFLLEGLSNSFSTLEILSIEYPEEILIDDFKKRHHQLSGIQSPVSLVEFINLRSLRLSAHLFFGRQLGNDRAGPQCNGGCEYNFDEEFTGDRRGNAGTFLENLPRSLEKITILGGVVEGMGEFRDVLVEEGREYLPRLSRVHLYDMAGYIEGYQWVDGKVSSYHLRRNSDGGYTRVEEKDELFEVVEDENMNTKSCETLYLVHLPLIEEL